VTTPDALAPSAASRRYGWLDLTAPLGGLLFVAFVVVLIITGEGPGDTAEEVIAYAEDKSGAIDALGLFSLLSLIFLGAFLGGLFVRLQAVGARVEATFALAAGAAFAVLFFVAMMLWYAPLIELDAEESAALQTAQAETYLGLEDIGWFTLGGGGVAAGLMIIVASIGARRGGLVPAWAGWVGVALGIVGLATVTFIGILAWLLWIVLASILMLWPKRATAA
jgi:hypothetical protein